MAISIDELARALWPQTRKRLIEQIRYVMPELPEDFNPTDEMLQDFMSQLVTDSICPCCGR